MTDNELYDIMQEAIDNLDTQIADLPSCSLRTLMVAQRDQYDEFFRLVKNDGVVRASYKKYHEEIDRYEDSGYSLELSEQLAFDSCVDLGTMDYVAHKMIGGDDDE